VPSTLFVVDDSATMRKVFELTFAGEEVSVVTHDGSDGAVAKIREVRPQAAIVDVSLANGSTGYDLVRSIRAEGGIGPIPIYLLYSEHSPLDEPAARSCGAVGAIVKPFESQVLIDKVRQALATAKPPSAATTGNMTAPFGNPQPVATIVAAMPPAPNNKGAETAPFTAPRPAPVATRPATGANPVARGPVPPPSSTTTATANPPGHRPPPLPGGGRAPTPGVPAASIAAKAPEKPVEKPVAAAIAEDEVQFEPAPRTVDVPSPAKPAPTVHDKATAPVMAPAVDSAVQAAAKAVEGHAASLGLSPAQVEAITALTREVVERVVWEVVPQLAETMIREELKRLTAD
jgi:CheY-like chemotaxis protein